MAIKAYSYSRLRTYEECPAAYRSMLDRLPKDEPRVMVVGQFAHQAIEDYVKKCFATEVPSDAGLIPVVLGRLKKCPEPIKNDVRRILERFVETYEVRLEQPDLETRRAFTARWKPTEWFGRDVRFRAVLDLVEVLGDGAVRITDWKTGWKVPRRSEAEENGQLQIYAHVASLIYPEARTFRLRIWYVRQAYTHEFELDRGDIDHVREDLERRMAVADAETEFAARPGEHCERCLYRRGCAVYRAAGRSSDMPEETRELAAEWCVLKARVKDMEDMLRARIEDEGPLEQPGGTVLGYQAQRTVKIADAEAAVAELLEAGVQRASIWSELGLSKTAVEKLLRRAGERERIAPFLERHGVISVRSVFRVHKADTGS